MESANRRETFVYSGSGMNRADTGGDIPDMFLRAERGIHCENQRRWMSFFDVCKYGFEIQRMNRRIQCSVNMDIFPAMSGKLLTDQRTKTVACDPVTSDAKNDNFFPGPVNLSDAFFQHMSQFSAGGAFFSLYNMKLLCCIQLTRPFFGDPMVCSNRESTEQLRNLPILYPWR